MKNKELRKILNHFSNPDFQIHCEYAGNELEQLIVSNYEKDGGRLLSYLRIEFMYVFKQQKRKLKNVHLEWSELKIAFDIFPYLTKEQEKLVSSFVNKRLFEEERKKKKEFEQNIDKILAYIKKN